LQNYKGKFTVYLDYLYLCAYTCFEVEFVFTDYIQGSLRE